MKTTSVKKNDKFIQRGTVESTRRSPTAPCSVRHKHRATKRNRTRSQREKTALTGW